MAPQASYRNTKTHTIIENGAFANQARSDIMDKRHNASALALTCTDGYQLNGQDVVLELCLAWGEPSHRRTGKVICDMENGW